MECIAFRPQYMEIVDGNAAAALLLSQIVYWYLPAKGGGSKLKVQHDGMWWLAKSYRHWEEELGLSRMKSRTCMDILLRKQLIELRVFMFNGHPMQHLRLRFAKGVSRLEKVPTVADLLGDPMVGSNQSNGYSQPIHWLPSANPLVTGSQFITESTAESTAESTTRSALPPAFYGTGETYEGQTGEGNMNAEDTVKYVQDTHVPCEKGMTILWKDVMGRVYGKKIPYLTGKGVGQLKIFKRRVGEQAGAVLTHTIENWIDFANNVEVETKVKGLALTPDPGVLILGTHIAQRRYEKFVQSIAQIQKQNLAAKTPEALDLLDNELTEPVKPFSIKEHIASMKAEEARKREEYLKAENQEKAAHNELTELHGPVPQYLTLKEKLQAQGTIK